MTSPWVWPHGIVRTHWIISLTNRVKTLLFSGATQKYFWCCKSEPNTTTYFFLPLYFCSFCYHLLYIQYIADVFSLFLIPVFWFHSWELRSINESFLSNAFWQPALINNLLFVLACSFFHTRNINQSGQWGMLVMFEADYHIIIPKSLDRDKKQYNDDGRGDLECPFLPNFTHRVPLQDPDNYL